MSIEYLGNGNLQYGPSGPVVYRGSRTGAAASNWWEAGGATGAVAVYQPIGAASLAASYVNLANPGTYDAAPGVAPTWDAVNGWTGDGSAYLTTGIVPGSGWSMIALFSDIPTGANNTVAGLFTDSPTNARFYLRPVDNPARHVYGYGNSASIGTGDVQSGVMAIAGQNCYLNGSPDGTAGTWVTTAFAIHLMAFVTNAGAIAGIMQGGYLQAVAIYNTTLTADQVSAVSTAMAALT